MSCDAQSLVNNTPALNAIPIGLVPYAQLSLLCSIAKNYDMSLDCSAATLVDNAKCLACAVPPGLVQFAALYLLCQIQAGGGGGTASVTVAAGAPPVDGSISTLFYKNSVTGQKFINVGTVAVPVWEAI